MGLRGDSVLAYAMRRAYRDRALYLPDFSNKVRPGGFCRANLPAPGKRPLSSMTPAIIVKTASPIGSSEVPAARPSSPRMSR